MSVFSRTLAGEHGEHVPTKEYAWIDQASTQRSIDDGRNGTFLRRKTL